jgi:hypothetical protein
MIDRLCVALCCSRFSTLTATHPAVDPLYVPDPIRTFHLLLWLLSWRIDFPLFCRNRESSHDSAAMMLVMKESYQNRRRRQLFRVEAMLSVVVELQVISQRRSIFLSVCSIRACRPSTQIVGYARSSRRLKTGIRSVTASPCRFTTRTHPPSLCCHAAQ